MPRTKYNVFLSLIERYILFKIIFHICQRARSLWYKCCWNILYLWLKNARKNKNHFGYWVNFGYWVDFGYWEDSGTGVNYWISFSRTTSSFTYCHYALKVSPFFHTYLSLLSMNDYQSSMKYFTKDGQFHLNICLKGLHAGRASHIFFQYDTKWLRVRQSESF